MEMDRYYSLAWLRLMNQPDIRGKIMRRRSQKKRRLAKRRAGKRM